MTIPGALSAGKSAALARYGVKTALELPLVGKLGPMKLMGLGALGSVLWDKHRNPQPPQQSVAYAPLTSQGAY